ncbi:MAG: ATP-dependent zinc protease [Myxococcales bacterium]|nr:ATP-dependent zinc protease [Myxococcales bacterium]
MRSLKQRTIIGWREWVVLPELGVEAVKAKTDTGARTSALHAFDISTVSREGRSFACFVVHPLQRTAARALRVEAEIIDERTVTNSGGHAESRPVILTTMELAGQSFSIEISLTDRDVMGFRMLLGREALKSRFLVDPARSFFAGRAGKPKKNPKVVLL